MYRLENLAEGGALTSKLLLEILFSVCQIRQRFQRRLDSDTVASAVTCLIWTPRTEAVSLTKNSLSEGSSLSITSR
jgi:hypothetical protein